MLLQIQKIGDLYFTTENFVPSAGQIFFAKFCFSIYLISLIFTTIYCLFQLQLWLKYRKYRKAHPTDPALPIIADADLPIVTVQLPMFNEMYVAEKLIDVIARFDYPKDKLEIHILDDSTDETQSIAANKVKEYKDLGYKIEYIHRTNRQGYKAGALKEGMDQATGEFLAIFDADFEPHPDFLRKTIPYFLTDPKIGVVQTRWEHSNENYSMITKLQALQLNVHFTVEQMGRSAGEYLLQFNGTAGVWRRKTIEDAGGWEADTLTEDLDLSYRAQMCGYRILYLEKLGSPAELPAEMNALKGQQHRWMKGGAESAKKLLPSVWKSKVLTFWQKMQASGHLVSSSLFLFVFLLGVMSVPVMHTMHWIGIPKKFFSWFMAGFLSMVIVYYTANINADIKGTSKEKLFWRFLGLYPLFLCLSMGLAFHNTIAVVQGWWGKKSEFVRTPKFNIRNITDNVKKGNYIKTKLKWPTIMEGVLCLYFILGILDGIIWNNTEFLIFHIMLALGYGSICFYSIKHMNLKA